MAHPPNRIEHRWGRRYRVDIPVRAAVSFSETPVAFSDIECRLRNLSLSGALIRSEHDFRVHSVIDVIIRLPIPAQEQANVKAHITRKLKKAVGVEWCDFAPPAVKELLRLCGSLSPVPHRL